MTATRESADFLALVCADEDWLRAEFDEIVAASWGSAPPPRPRPRPQGRPPAGPDPGAAAPDPPAPTGRVERNAELRARQRAPPARLRRRPR
jgi:hypothetical protein